MPERPGDALAAVLDRERGAAVRHDCDGGEDERVARELGEWLEPGRPLVEGAARQARDEDGAASGRDRGVVFVNLFRGGSLGGGYAAFDAASGALLAVKDIDGEDNNSYAPPVISRGTLLLGGDAANPGTLKAYRP
jgi:hypothetical protein